MGEAPTAGAFTEYGAAAFEPSARSKRDEPDSAGRRAGRPRVGAAATEVAGAARALGLEFVDLVAVRVRAGAEAMVGVALVALLLAIGWLAAMVALAIGLTRWWPVEGAVLSVAGIHLALGIVLAVRLTAAGPRTRSGARSADVGTAR